MRVILTLACSKLVAKMKPPYGYLCIAGELVEHPLEQARVQIIRELAQKGMKAWRIAEELKRLQVSARKGQRWCHKTIGK